MQRGQLALDKTNQHQKFKAHEDWRQAWPGQMPQSKHCIQMLIMASQYANWQSLQYAD